MRYLIIILLLCSHGVFAQDTIQIDEPMDSLELEELDQTRGCDIYLEPEFPGGDEALFQYLKDSLDKSKFTIVADKCPDMGMMYVQFIVETDGSILVYNVVNGCDENLENYVTEIFENMPKWKPGLACGKKYRVKYTVPILIHPK